MSDDKGTVKFPKMKVIYGRPKESATDVFRKVMSEAHNFDNDTDMVRHIDNIVPHAFDEGTRIGIFIGSENIAYKLLKENMDIAFVSRMTGLTEEQVMVFAEQVKIANMDIATIQNKVKKKREATIKLEEIVEKARSYGLGIGSMGGLGHSWVVTGVKFAGVDENVQEIRDMLDMWSKEYGCENKNDKEY